MSGEIAMARSMMSSRSSTSRAASASIDAVASTTAAAKPTMAGVSRVPDRTCRSWPPPWVERDELRTPPDDEGADADGTTELVGRHRHEVCAAGGEVDGQVPGGLHGVGVQRDVELVGHVGERPDVLHGADLVVGPHDRHERDRARV